MIEVQNLDVRLPGFALENISLCVPQGAFGALIGPTGSGKSILLEALAGLQPVKRGQIFNHRGEITRLPPERRGFGLVYQTRPCSPTSTSARIFFLHGATRILPRLKSSGK